MNFIERFIEILKTAKFDNDVWTWNGRTMADVLETRITKPRGDGFDIDVTGKDDVDRANLATWIEKGAHAPPYCAPMYGRNFSEAIAWLLRHKLEAQDPLPADACSKAFNDDKFEQRAKQRQKEQNS